MTFRIHHSPTEDSIIISGKTIGEIRQQASREMAKRGWKEADCWSEEIK